MTIKPRAEEYEYRRPDGTLVIYAGHPCYCMNPKRHRLHVFRFTYRFWDGSGINGSYVCNGEPAIYPVRWIDR